MRHSVALVFEDREYTLAHLESLAGGLAATLRARGVRGGDRVALMSSNRPEFVIAVLAVWRLGAAVVLLSPAWKQAEVAHALAITRPVQAVGDHPVLAGFLPMLSLDDPIAPAYGMSPVPEPEAEAILVFSSGTTGLPKAVRHTHASLAVAVEHWRGALEFTATDRIQVLTPPSHILGLLNILLALRTGAWLRLHRRFDLELMLRHIEKDRITVEMAVAPIAMALAAHPDLEAYDLSSLRYIMWGATPVSASVAATVTRRTGVGWVPAYGTSELPVIACNPIEGARLDSVGRPVPGVRVRVVSPETGNVLGPGEIGEIQARSGALMSGYLPDSATASVWSDGWYRTGDIGSLDAGGWLRLTDRLKEMIKVRGFQVAPAEVEAVLHAHPAVVDCAVFGVPDAADGEAIVAAVSTSVAIGRDELVDFVGTRLASYKRPRAVVFVPRIPRLPSGKVLRRVLKEQYGRTSDE
ncbi:class I adenylate-forming enzyme family protein [Nocardia goodfellowii]|uniref:Acyl-CoA synthetase (AMP-forming)/AMP-acid ligase II n=1 Tax=Nocardia goodfellowii TaxID=882446 RepID=A0ABS4QLH2_9NOCA|nr:AMP-binding protein [Nocardia goodfellowii]MBP2191948.1 acyl-CoA synthetase (AMP-forming)/AMP-acid ligase II [Nocardia goodfellowii]